VMDFVSVKLTTNDAFSSIRGVYGGVGLTLFIALMYKLQTNVSEALGFLTILWGLYASCRIITVVTQGPLGHFGVQWLIIESVFFLASTTLYFCRKPSKRLHPLL
jgi:Domain of unknown function (DUF4345)